MVRRNSKKTSDAEAEALLSSANKASEHLAVLHVAFLAVCAYVLVIVFGTTDLELLIGKGVKLPVIDVMLPIVGFYLVAPYIVVLVHFNLLLQLQLLSRKLYAFDAAAPEEDRIGSMRDRLHIFPFTYYLIGQTGRGGEGSARSHGDNRLIYTGISAHDYIVQPADKVPFLSG